MNKHVNIKCGNCGIKGHVYSNCKLPILSYGIILYKNCKITGRPKILLIQRKDSLTYIEYIRGKYNINDKSYLQMMFNRMSREELSRLEDNDLEYLWTNNKTSNWILWRFFDNWIIVYKALENV